MGNEGFVPPEARRKTEGFTPPEVKKKDLSGLESIVPQSTQSQSVSGGSTSELEGSTSGTSKSKPQPELVSSLGVGSFSSLAKTDTQKSPYVGNKDNYLRRKKMEDTLRKNAASNPDLLKTPGIEDALQKKILGETNDNYLAKSLKQTLKSLKRESDILKSDSQENLDVIITPQTQGILQNISKANVQMNKDLLIQQGKTEEEADAISNVIFPDQENQKSLNSGLNMDKVKKDYLTYLYNNDKESFDDIRKSANVGGFNDKKSMSLMRNSLEHQANIVDSKIKNILSSGVENLSEDDIKNIEQLESQMAKLSDRHKGLLLDYPEIHKELVENKLKQKAVDDDYQLAKAKALLPGFDGSLAKAKVFYEQAISPIGASAVKFVGDITQFALHQIANFTPDEKVEGIANIVSDWAGDYFDTEKTGSIYKKPTALKGSLFEEKTLTSEGGFKPEKLVPKFSETLFQMYALLGGGGIAGGAMESVGIGAGLSQKLGLITSSFVTTQNDYYQEAKELGMSNNEANNFGNAAGLVTSMLELINPQGYVFGKEAKKEFTKSVFKSIAKGVDMKDAIKQNSKFIAKELIGENIQETSQMLGDAGVKYLFNKKNEDDAFDLTITQEEIKEMVLLTSIISGIGSSHGVKGRNQLETESLYYAAKDFDKFKNTISSSEIKEQMNEKDIQSAIEKVAEYKKVVDGLPKNLSEEKEMELAEKIYAKKKIVESKKDIYVDDIVSEKTGDETQSQVDELNTQIKSILEDKSEPEKPTETFELKSEGKKVEYKINDGFFSEEEIISNLGDDKFVESVKNGDVNLTINNPTPEVLKALENSGLLTKTQLEEVKPMENTGEAKPKVEGSGVGGDKTGLIVYHGTPHAFENFDISKLGTGEGMQAFGHGLYFTNEKSIAEGYANNLSSRQKFWKTLEDGNEISLSKDDFDFISKELDALGYDGEQAENANVGNIKVDGKDEYSPSTLEALAVVFGKNAEKDLRDYSLSDAEVSRMLEIKKKISDPQLYTASLHKGKSASEYDYINWSGELTPSQKSKLGEVEWNTGQEVYKALSKKLGSDKAASEYLLSKGIDGIVYKSNKGTGGKSGEGRNYVVFDAKSITIEDINGRNQTQSLPTQEVKDKAKPTISKEQQDATEKTDGKVPEPSKTQEKFKSVADNIRKLKTKEIKLTDKDGNEITITKQGLDWNDLVESVAVAVEKTGDVAAAISEYLSNNEWFNSQPDENKVAIEKQIKDNLGVAQEAKKEPEVKKETTPKQKTSKTVGRLRINELDAKEKERLKEIGNYDPLNIKEYNKAIKELVDLLGIDGAIEYADSLSDNLTDGSAAKKKQIHMTAASLKLLDAQARKNKAIEEGNLVDKAKAEDDMAVAYSVINDAARIGTAAGQLNAIDAELHKQFPSLYMINALNHLEKSSPLENTETFKDENGNEITVEQAINNLRDSISAELRKDIEEEFNSKIDDLKNKIEELKNQKPVSTEQRKRELKKSIDDKWAKFKKASKKASSVSFVGLNNYQIELLGLIIVDYVKLGGLTASGIIKKVAKEARAISKNISDDHIENIAKNINEFNELISSEKNESLNKIKDDNLTDKEKEAITKKAIEVSGKKILDIAKDHYVNRRGVSRTLAQSLIDEAGLDMDSAKNIAESLEKIISSKIEERVAIELNKFLQSTDKDSSPEKIEGRSQNKKLYKKIIEAINLGALNNGDDFQKAFEDKFGFRTIDVKTKSRLNTIIEELTIMENNKTKNVVVNGEEVVVNTTKREDVLRLQREFNTILESSTPLNYNLVLKEINGAIYISILSDLTSTSIKAIIGSIVGATFGVASETLKNRVASFLGIVEATKSVGTSFNRALTAFKTGVVEVGKTQTMGEFSSDKQNRLETALFKGFRESIKEGKYKDAALSIYGKTLKNIRILAAMDAFLVSQSGIYYDTVSEKGTKSDANSINSKIGKGDMNVVYKDIASDEFSNIKKDAENEVDFAIKNGIIKESQRDTEIKNRIAQKIGSPTFVNQKSFYESKRVQELKENQNYETFQKAWNMGQYFSLVGKPDGYIGMGTSYLQGKLSINKEDSKGVASAKFGANMLLKFVNLMGNFYNATATSIPLLGMANAFFGAGYNPVTGEYDPKILGKLNSNKRLVYNRVATNAIITSLVTAALFDQLDWDDEEEEFKLNPDRTMDFRGSGFSGIGGYTKNLTTKENYEPFSFSWTKDAEGNFTDYHTFNQYIPQLNAIVATVSAMTDDLKDMKSSSGIDFRKRNPFIGYSSQILDQNFKGFMEGSFNSVGRAIKPFMYEDTFLNGLSSFVVNTLADNISPLLKPNSHIAVMNYIKTAYDAPKKKAKTVGERMIQNLYGLDHLILDDKTDAFGNPYPQTNDIERFVTEIPKMSELYPKTTGLLFKFEERGLNVYKWRNTEMKSYADGFALNGRKYRVYDSSIQEEAVKIQEELFNKYVSDNYKSYSKIENIDVLERLIKFQQDRSKREAKRQMVKKYVDKTDKKAKIMVVD